MYTPIFDYNRYEPEDIGLYLERALKHLPNFPKEVIIQWFYDHPQQIDEHKWLGYEKLKFELLKWKTDEVPITDFGNTDAVETYMYNYFERGISTSRRDRIESYFNEHGTWPVPPIFLENLNGDLEYPHGFPCGKPYHLLEGHNRMAFFIKYKKLKKLSETHLVYIAEKGI